MRDGRPPKEKPPSIDRVIRVASMEDADPDVDFSLDTSDREDAQPRSRSRQPMNKKLRCEAMQEEGRAARPIAIAQPLHHSSL
jgi:hypothetical protein